MSTSSGSISNPKVSNILGINIFVFKLAFDPVEIVASNVITLSSTSITSKFFIIGLILTSTVLPFLFFLVIIISSSFIKSATLVLTNSLDNSFSTSKVNIYSPYSIVDAKEGTSLVISIAFINSIPFGIVEFIFFKNSSQAKSSSISTSRYSP